MTSLLSVAGGTALEALLPQNTSETYEFAAGPFPRSRFVVVAFRGEESMSNPFGFDVELITWRDPLVETMPTLVLRQPAYLRIAADGYPPRFIRGVVAKFEIVSVDVVKELVYARARLVPKLWLLQHRITSRIFQEQSVDQIISEIFDEWQIAYRWHLDRPLPVRTYATQYQESDLTFITRLLAEEGLFYFFEPPPAALLDVGEGVGGAVMGAASMVGNMVGGPLKAATDAVAEASMETVVLADNHMAYLPILGSSVEDMASAAMGAAGDLLGGPVGQAAEAVASMLSPTLEMDLNQTHAREDQVAVFGQGDEARPESVFLSDYDFRRPLLKLQSQASTVGASDALGGAVESAVGGMARLSVSSSGVSVQGALTTVASAALTSNLPSLPSDCSSVYLHDDLGEDETDWEHLEVDKARARRTLEQLRADFRTGEGQSWCRRLSAGHRFSLAGHPLEWLNNQYVVVAIKHHAEALVPAEALGTAAPAHANGKARCYHNQFTCVAATKLYRPPVPVRELRQVMETATVVGARGQEICVDEFGRIKVQFHWDAEGANDERSSCWLRTAQAWSGAGWGTQVIPRVGMEVLVSFLRGNPDRPLVVGCVPNATTPVPFDLPEHATRSGIKTYSSPNGRGYNELSFEDLANFEQINLHAQRNFDEHVGHDHTLSVTHNDTEIINGVRTEITGQHLQTVWGRKSSAVQGDRQDNIERSHTISIKMDRTESVGGYDSRSVGQAQSLRVNGSRSISVDGFLSTMVGTEKQPADAMTSVIGAHTTYATDAIRIVSEKKIVLEVGDSSVVIEPEKIQIRTKTLAVVTDEKLTMEAPGSEAQLAKDSFEVAAKKANLYSSGASLELSSNADLNGAKVRLNCGAGSSDLKNADGSPVKLKPLKLTLHDDDMNPFANKKYRLFVAGIKFEGTTDGKGSLTEQVPEDATLGQLTLWLDEYPTGTRINWPVEMIDGPLPDPTSIEGALIRLTQLGYYSDPIGPALGPKGEAAIRVFQDDYQVPVTGKLDDATSAKLKEIYGA